MQCVCANETRDYGWQECTYNTNINCIQASLLPILRDLLKFNKGKTLRIRHRHRCTEHIQAQLQELFKTLGTYDWLVRSNCIMLRARVYFIEFLARCGRSVPETPLQITQTKSNLQNVI